MTLACMLNCSGLQLNHVAINQKSCSEFSSDQKSHLRSVRFDLKDARFALQAVQCGLRSVQLSSKKLLWKAIFKHVEITQNPLYFPASLNMVFGPQIPKTSYNLNKIYKSIGLGYTILDDSDQRQSACQNAWSNKVADKNIECSGEARVYREIGDEPEICHPHKL